MSDRIVFLPCLHPIYGNDFRWADIVVPEEASIEETHQAAKRFAGMPGPHKIMLRDRKDPRFVEFCRYLAEEFYMRENSAYGYSVYLSP